MSRTIHNGAITNRHVLVGELPDALRQDAEMYAGCIAGAIQRTEYLKLISDMGFKNITVQKEKPIVIPDDVLSKYLTDQELNTFDKRDTGIFSITVYAEKSGTKTTKPKVNLSDIQTDSSCCTPKSDCC